MCNALAERLVPCCMTDHSVKKLESYIPKKVR